MTEVSSLQKDEIAAISAIFGDDWICEDVDNRAYSIELKREPGANCDKFIRLGLKFPEDYPSKSPPIYEISAPWMSRKLKTQMKTSLDKIYEDNLGESIIYLWVEKAKEYLFKEVNDDFIGSNPNEVDAPEESYSYVQETEKLELNVEIIHGEPVTDRRSAFQAHVAQVSNMEQVKHVVETLKSNKKIATATHNIVAYRIITSNDIVLQDCDDDGETHAGSRLLHLLQILDAINVVVVVSRWFGGIQLGPDRFKHINNVARDLLDKSGLLPLPRKSNKKTK